MLIKLLLFILYISLLLLGMAIMKSSLNKSSHTYLRRFLERFMDRPWKGLVTGSMATAILQTSSGVTVIVIGLVSAGQLAFRHTVGVILGANIGTTVTGELALIPIHHPVFLATSLMTGVFLFLFTRFKTIGAIVIGLSCLFIAMMGFSSLARPLSGNHHFQGMLIYFNDHLFFSVIAGFLFTATVHSSSAATLVAMSFLGTGSLSLPAAFTFILGANVGTCMTAYLASLGTNWEAKWVFYTHMLFNILGVVLFFPLTHPFLQYINTLSSHDPTRLAHASVLFNIITAFLALPFAGYYGRWVEKKHASLR